MESNVDHILSDALALPDVDRVELVEAIIASLRSDDRPPFDESWREVIARRSAELRSGQVIAAPWADVKRRGRESIGD
jgi:putative addiction module component (TIGR02574 family)